MLLYFRHPDDKNKFLINAIQTNYPADIMNL